ncbi:MAG: carboxypeptidase regulatory-like domain-containing protein [bacterium]|nr:carboxypeptidase regulatory-like domain-containing protein [bacterium]
MIEGSGIVSAEGRERAKTFGYEYREYARARINKDGSFVVPRALESDRLLLWVTGDYFRGGAFDFEVGSAEDPGETPLQLQCKVLAHVTFELHFPPDATTTDKQNLIGRPVFLIGETNNEEQGSGPWAEPQLYRLQLDENFQITIPHTGDDKVHCIPGPWPWSDRFEEQKFDLHDSAFAPFTPANRVELDILPGERVHFPIELEWSPKLLGRVVGPNGEPVEGARITAHNIIYPTSHDVDLFTYSCATKHDGSFVLHGLPARDIILEARSPYRQPTRLGPAKLFAARATGHAVTLVMSHQPTLHGQVVWPEGTTPRPMEIEVRFKESGRYDTTKITIDPGEDGRFAFPTTFGTKYTLNAVVHLEEETDSSPVGPLVAKATCRAGSSSPKNPIQLPLVRAASVRVRVMEEGDDSQMKCAVGFVEAHHPPRPDYQTEWTGYRSAKSAGGSYWWQLNPGDYTFQASLQVGRGLKRTVTKQAQLMGGQNEVTLILPALKQVSGRVVDQSRAGIPDALVTITDRNKRRPVQGTPKVVTDTSGRFVAENLPPGEYLATVEAADRLTIVDWPFEVSPHGPPADWEISTKGGAYIDATVLDRFGDPAQDAHLSVTNEKGQPLGSYAREQSSPLGRVRIGPVPPGPVHVSMQIEQDKGSYRISQSLAATLHGTPAITIDASEAPSAIVAGILSSGGKSLAGYNLRLREGDSSGLLSSSTKTDAAGHFEMRLHKLGQYHLSVHGPGPWQVHHHQPFAIHANPAPLQLSLPTGAIQGWVENASQSGTLGVFAIKDGDGAMTPHPVSEAEPNDDSSFLLQHLPDGRYSLVLRRRRAPRDTKPASNSISVVVRDGKMTEGVVLVPVD